MALDVVSNWHDQLAQQERQRVMLRIANGTKASSPQILNARREMPLFYSNPLPDNSSGSKNRPIGLMKDESGRPNANEIVAMNQAKHHFSHGGSNGVMEGGVLRHFKYGQQILKQRARDAENINLASQGLPPNPEPGVELNEIDSRNLELNNLLSGIEESIELSTISNLTLNELKNVPRLLIYLSPSLDAGRISELIDYIDGLIVDIDTLYSDSDSKYAQNAKRVKSFLEQLKLYLTQFVPYVNYSDEEKRMAAVQIAKEVFKLKKTPKAILAEVARPAPPASPPGSLPPPPDEGPPDDEEEESEAESEGTSATERARRDEKVARAEAHNEALIDEFNDAVSSNDIEKMRSVADRIVVAVPGQGTIGRKAIPKHNSARFSTTRLFNLIMKKTGWTKR